MKSFMQVILLISLLSGCKTDDTPKLSATFEKPIAMNVYCQGTPDQLLRRIEYEYNGSNLVTETTLVNGEEDIKQTYAYDSKNLLVKLIIETSLTKVVKTYEYNGLNQLTNVIHTTFHYDVSGAIVNENTVETPMEYENGQLVKEWKTWGGYTTYAYKNNKVTTMTEYTVYGTQHHITKYKYSGDLKIEERTETATGTLLHLKTFQYDGENRLVTILDGEDIIEENIYEENKLKEKRTFYFGIDPGFDICYGNYIYRYE